MLGNFRRAVYRLDHTSRHPVWRSRPQVNHLGRRLRADAHVVERDVRRRVRSLTVVCETNGSARPPVRPPARPAPRSKRLRALNEPMFARRLVTPRRRLFVRVPPRTSARVLDGIPRLFAGRRGNRQGHLTGGMFVDSNAAGSAQSASSFASVKSNRARWPGPVCGSG